MTSPCSKYSKMHTRFQRLKMAIEEKYHTGHFYVYSIPKDTLTRENVLAM